MILGMDRPGERSDLARKLILIFRTFVTDIQLPVTGYALLATYSG
jgi:hypothetical protein